jgi:hypothetical protein
MECTVSIATDAVGEGIRQSVGRRLHLALGRFQRRIERVRVRLEDANGPRGGVDQRCRILVRLYGLNDVVIEHLDADVYGALDRAAGRAASAVARRLDRASRTSAMRRQVPTRFARRITALAADDRREAILGAGGSTAPYTSSGRLPNREDE